MLSSSSSCIDVIWRAFCSYVKRQRGHYWLPICWYAGQETAVYDNSYPWLCGAPRTESRTPSSLPLAPFPALHRSHLHSHLRPSNLLVVTRTLIPTRCSVAIPPRCKPHTLLSPPLVSPCSRDCYVRMGHHVGNGEKTRRDLGDRKQRDSPRRHSNSSTVDSSSDAASRDSTTNPYSLKMKIAQILLKILFRSCFAVKVANY